MSSYSDPENPYLAPKAASVDPYAQQSHTGGYTGYAGFWLRLVAWIIDYLIVFAANLAIGMGIGIILGIGVAASGGKVDGDAFQIAATAIGWVLGITVQVCYNAIMTASSMQATLGKMALGLKVTDLYGQRISLGRAIGREFAKYLSGFTIAIGYIMAAFTEKKQALHDMIASTLVLKTR